MQQSNQVNKIVPRAPFNQILLQRSFVPLYILFFVTNASMLVLVLITYFILGIFIGYDFIFYPVLLVIEILSLALYIFVNYAYYRRYLETQYQIIPGYIHQIGDAIADQVPGKIEATTGGIFDKESTVLRIDEYDRTRVTQTMLSKMYNYGNIHLEQVDELQNVNHYVLSNIVNPFEATKIIQTMIDIEVNQAQPVFVGMTNENNS